MNVNAKCILLGLIIVNVFILAFALPAGADTGTITGSVVNVRSGPGQDNQVTGNLYQDTEVTVLEESSDWYKVKFGELTGWVHNSLINVKKEERLQVTGETVNLRSGPGLSYSVVGQASKGDLLYLLDVEGEWYKARTAEGKEVYIHSSLAGAVDKNEQPSEIVGYADGRKVQVEDGPVNVRGGPGTSYAKMGMIGDEEIFPVLGEEGGWYKIRLTNGSEAWVAGWLVREIGAEGETPDAGESSSSAGTEPAPPKVILDQRELEFDVPPIIENGRTLVPLRAIFEAMGASVQWNNATRTVTAAKGGTTVVLPIGSTAPTVNGKTWELDVPAKIVNDRTLAPLRFVGEAFGGQVAWDEDTRTIAITSPVTSAPEAVAVTVKEEAVNLRSAPSIASDRVDLAYRGESLTVLSQDSGWYQVSRGGRTAWVASWVVDVAWEADEPVVPAEPPEEEEPVEEQLPELPKPATEIVRVSCSRDDSGIKIVMGSGAKLEFTVEEKSGRIKYEFAGRQLEGPVSIEEPIGQEKMEITGSNKEDSAVVEIKLPAGIAYRTASEDGGKKEILTIPNSIVGVGRKVCGDTGERIIIYTVVPCEYIVEEVEDDKLEVRLESVSMGKAREEYVYKISKILDRMTVKESEDEEPDTILTVKTESPFKYALAQEADNALNIILTLKQDYKDREKLVVLDPGHGGKDPGAVGTQLKEKNVNLAVALRAGELLEKKGIDVEYTRTSDCYLTLRERAEIANRLNAAVFVSIHANSYNYSDRAGTETYFYAPVEFYEQRAERTALANILQQKLLQNLKRQNRGVKEAEFTVLKETRMPSALVELAFISNPEEQRLLQQDYFRELAAEAIAEAIEEYLEDL